MGVHGWHRFLIENNWLPPRRRPPPATTKKHPRRRGGDAFINNVNVTSTSPWLFYSKEEQQQSEEDIEDDDDALLSSLLNPMFIQRLVVIPKSAILLFDGYGLAFHLHKIAYARYYLSDYIQKKEGANTNTSILLPNFLPMAIVDQVTKEFIKVFQSSGRMIKVYWDGPLRYQVKQATDSKRLNRRESEWENLYKYCEYGIIPTNTNTNTTSTSNKRSSKSTSTRNIDLDDWFDLFPGSTKLAIAQVINTLSNLNVPMEMCDEEADNVLAELACGSRNTYVIGNDTDYCFFENINYIPLETLGVTIGNTNTTNNNNSINKNKTANRRIGWGDHITIKGCVIRRDDLYRSIFITATTSTTTINNSNENGEMTMTKRLVYHKEELMRLKNMSVCTKNPPNDALPQLEIYYKKHNDSGGGYIRGGGRGRGGGAATWGESGGAAPPQPVDQNNDSNQSTKSPDKGSGGIWARGNGCSGCHDNNKNTNNVDTNDVDDRLMVEVAILCGNDYLSDPFKANINDYPKPSSSEVGDQKRQRRSTSMECIQHLLLKQRQQRKQSQDSSDCCYQITSSSKEVQSILQFIRALYSHDESVLATYPLCKKGPGSKKENKNNHNSTKHGKHGSDSSLPRFPEVCFLPLKEPAIQTLFLNDDDDKDDHKVGDHNNNYSNIPATQTLSRSRVDSVSAVSKCVQMFLDNCADDGEVHHDDRMITLQHLQAFQEQHNSINYILHEEPTSRSTTAATTASAAQSPPPTFQTEVVSSAGIATVTGRSTNPPPPPSTLSSSWRPKWEHMYSSYFIEKIIHRLVMAYPKCCTPYQAFDPMAYHMKLSQQEFGSCVPNAIPSANDNDNGEAVASFKPPAQTPLLSPPVENDSFKDSSHLLAATNASSATTASSVATCHYETPRSSSRSRPNNLLQPSQVSWSLAQKLQQQQQQQESGTFGEKNHITEETGNNFIEKFIVENLHRTSEPVTATIQHQQNQSEVQNVNSVVGSSPDLTHLLSGPIQSQQKGDPDENYNKATYHPSMNDAAVVNTGTAMDQPYSTTEASVHNVGLFLHKHVSPATENIETRITDSVTNDGAINPVGMSSLMPSRLAWGNPSATLRKDQTHRDDSQFIGMDINRESGNQIWNYGWPDEKPAVSSTIADGIQEYAQAEEPIRLPVDDHKEKILDAIRRSRVTVIQAETGAGKSTRVPCFLLRSKDIVDDGGDVHKPRLWISQPRRIAAKALVERLRTTEPDLRDCFALRLGHGVREYESDQTRAWFVTTGYLVRLLANHPENFAWVDYILIDEVHERSVDTDLLCFLCRRLLQKNQRVKLVLMSATLAAEMYREYFNIAEAAIFVGARRFPVEEVYLDELSDHHLKFPSRTQQNIQKMFNSYSQMKCRGIPNANQMELIYTIVLQLTVQISSPGSSVLVFVSGMADIVALFDAFEDLYVPGIRYTCLPIHSDIPFEDQMKVFRTCDYGEVKVVLATNAAESSLTLPDVDNVICLGLCKRIEYNELSHRQLLTATWISRASATQRSGRTGRVRPGTVYRLYTRENFEKDMDSFEPGEIVRTPLDSVILTLKSILGEDEVTSTLLDCIEPPKVATIGRSFESLFNSDFITAPGEQSDTTNLGTFVSRLGIDLTLGSLIGLGIQFGLAAEAVKLAGVLTFPQTPWILSNPMTHDPKSFNKMVKQTFVSQCDYDGGLLSEPFAIMNMLFDYEQKENHEHKSFFWKHGLHSARVRRLATTCANLKNRVAKFLDINERDLEMKSPPRDMNADKITILRVVQTWVFHETIIWCNPPNLKDEGGITVKLKPKSNTITEGNIKQFLKVSRHPCNLLGYREIRQTITFNQNFSKVMLVGTVDKLSKAEERFVSYAWEKDIGMVWIVEEPCSALYVRDDLAAQADFLSTLDIIQNDLSFKALVSAAPSGGRGVGERPCGLWSISVVDGEALESEEDSRLYYRFSGNVPAYKDSTLLLRNWVDLYVKNHSKVKALFCNPNHTVKKQNFSFRSMNTQQKISQQDMKDLFCSGDIGDGPASSTANNQSLFFPFDPQQQAETLVVPRTKIPLIQNVPEGYRLLMVLVSKRRGSIALQLPINRASFPSDYEDEDDYEEADQMFIYPEVERHSFDKWRRMGADQKVVVRADCIQATAAPADGKCRLYGCAANCLELKKRGDIKAEGITILPRGPLFVLLCRMTFGLCNNDSLDEEELVKNGMEFVRSGTEPEKVSNVAEQDWQRRIELAVKFHESCKYQGEELVCFPGKVKALVDIFNGMDVYV